MNACNEMRRAGGTGAFLTVLIGISLLIFAGIVPAQQTSLVSVSTGGAQSDGNSLGASVDATGRHVAFSSYADNLVIGDTNACEDVFVHDSLTGETTRVSVASDGMQADSRSSEPDLSADGRFVAFTSEARNLTALPLTHSMQVYVHDRLTGETTCVSVNDLGEAANGISREPSMSADGRYVAFCSTASNLIAGDAPSAISNVYVRDRLLNLTTRISSAAGGITANADSRTPDINADGRYVSFYSSATDLVPGDTNGCVDIFVCDRTTGQNVRASVSSGGAQANYDCFFPSISADGQCVTFQSLSSTLALNDTNGISDVFVRDLAAGQTTRVSLSSHGRQGNRPCENPGISADGRFVAFESLYNTVLVPGLTYGGIFVHDRQTGQTMQISTDDDGNEGVGRCRYPSISADGQAVAFMSDATNLVEGDASGVWDIFTRDWWRPSIVETGQRYPSIEAAIDAAVDGQTVALIPGTYCENVNFAGRDITLRSTSPYDPAVVAATIIDGASAASTVTFANGETAAATLSGLTITGGCAATGGGVYCSGSSPTIARNVIEGNEAAGQDAAYGGGVYCEGGSPTIIRNTIISNRAQADDVSDPAWGAGIFCTASDATITLNTINENSAWGEIHGTGIYCAGGNVVITDNTIKANARAYMGGGIFFSDAQVTLSGNTIEHNEALMRGGGLYWRNSTGTIADNSVSDNSAGSGAPGDLGAGMFIIGGSVSMTGNVIVGNESSGGAAGIFCGADAEISRNIISGNTAFCAGSTQAGGGIHCSGVHTITISGNTMAANNGGAIDLSGSSPAIVNNTLHGNGATGGAGVNCCNGSSPTISNTIIASSVGGSGVQADGTSAPVIRYSNVFGNAGGNYAGMDDQAGLNRNISADPLFADAANADFHLKSQAGRWTAGGWVVDGEHSPCIDAGDPATAVGDEAAPNAGRVNMGAFGGAEQASKSVYTVRIVETGKVYPFIQTAIDAAVDGQTVEAPPGTHHENITFAGKNITVRSENPNDPAVVAATIIDGGLMDSVVCFEKGETAGAVLTGLTITRGRAQFGGGIYCDQAEPIIRGNTISWSEAQDGAAIYCLQAAPTVTDNTVTHNRADRHGGGIFCSSSNAAISDNIIDENRAKSGGGVTTIGGAPHLTGNTITTNTAAEWGGAVYCLDSDATVEDNVIASNTSQVHGGGIYRDGGAGAISGNTISENTATAIGGGIATINSSVTINANTVADNHSDGTAGGIRCAGGAPTISANTIEGNTAGTHGGGILASICDLTISDNLIRRNAAVSNGGGVTVGGGAQTELLRNIVVNNTAGSGGGVYCSGDGPTINANTISANAATTSGGGVFISNTSTPVIITSSIVSFSDAGGGIAVLGTQEPTVTCSNVFGNTGGDYVGTDDRTGVDGNISRDPLFADVANGDYHLRSRGGRWTQAGWITDSEHSHCIDTGDPVAAVTDEPAPNGSRVNMGAYSGTAEASKSAAGPTLVAIDPTFGTNDGPAPLTITGSGFLPGAVATLTRQGEADIEAVSATVLDDRIECSADLNGASVGEWDVRVTNYDGQSSTLAESFRIVPPHAVVITADPVGAPDPVPSGGPVACSVTALDTLGHDLLYQWSAGGDAGSFDDPTAQNPTWTAPANITGQQTTVTLSVTVICADDPGISDTSSWVQTVEPEHSIVIIDAPAGDPDPAVVGDDVVLSVTAEDRLGHDLLYEWSADAGTFDDSSAQNPTWTAPAEPGDYEITVAVTCAVDPAISATASYIEQVLPVHSIAITEAPTGDPNPGVAGGDVVCSVTAADTHGHDLTYEWSADAGVFDDPAAQNPTWTAPEQAGEYEITVSVTCAEDAAITQAASYTQSVLPVHAIAITEAPAGDPDPAVAGETVACSVMAEDARGHDLIYEWSADAGAFDDPAAQNPAWTAPEQPGEYEITVTITCAEDPTVHATASYTQKVEIILRVDLSEGWNMISLGQPADSTADCAELLDSNTVEMLFSWRGHSFGYEQLDMAAAAHSFNGCGLWARSQAEDVRNISVQTPSPVTVDVARGWNLLANPYAAALDLQTGLRAEGAGTILLPAFTWNPAAHSYERGALVPAGQSFWALCLYDGEATLDPAGMAPTQTTAASVSIAHAPDVGAAEHLIQIVAATSEQSDNAVWLGTSAGEAWTVAKPPMIPGGVGAYLDVDGGIGYAQSLVPRGAEETWTLTVNSPADEEVSLRIVDTSHLPAEMAVWLSDEATGRRIDLRRAPEYAYTARTGQRRFEIELDERDDLLQVSGVAARAAGTGAQISFTLSGEGAVTVDVLNIAGRIVKRIVSDRDCAPGLQTLTWNGVSDRGTNAPAGIYLVRVTAEAPAGEQARSLTTMRFQ